MTTDDCQVPPELFLLVQGLSGTTGTGAVPTEIAEYARLMNWGMTKWVLVHAIQTAQSPAARNARRACALTAAWNLAHRCDPEVARIPFPKLRLPRDWKAAERRLVGRTRALRRQETPAQLLLHLLDAALEGSTDFERAFIAYVRRYENSDQLVGVLAQTFCHYVKAVPL